MRAVPGVLGYGPPCEIVGTNGQVITLTAREEFYGKQEKKVYRARIEG